MKELPFDPYDFFGYIASGLVIVVLLQITLGFPKVIGAELKPFDIAVTVLGVYIAGQIIAGPAKFALEDFFVHWLLGNPTKNLLRANTPKFGKWVFPGFYKPLPASIRARIAAKVNSMGLPEHDSEGLFLRVRFSPEILCNEALMGRINKFRDLFGFSRNVSFSLIIAALCLFGAGRIKGDLSLIHYGLIALIAGVLLLYRFLKFYRLYSYELLNTFACMGEKGKE